MDEDTQQNPWPVDKTEEVTVYPEYLRKYIEMYKKRKKASKAVKYSKEVYSSGEEEYKAPDYMQKYIDKYLGKQQPTGRKLNFDYYNVPTQKTGKANKYAITLNPREKFWKLINYFAKKYNKPLSRFCMEIIVKDLVVRMHHEKRNRENTA